MNAWVILRRPNRHPSLHHHRRRPSRRLPNCRRHPILHQILLL
ncbi:MAG: hypothetical protein U9O98_11460 [Asgard group archaeon]|nr:hypothetical protein [Asgard group archaeon]